MATVVHSMLYRTATTNRNGHRDICDFLAIEILDRCHTNQQISTCLLQITRELQLNYEIDMFCNLFELNKFLKSLTL